MMKDYHTMLTDSGNRNDKKHYFQTFLEECKHKVKKQKKNLLWKIN